MSNRHQDEPTRYLDLLLRTERFLGVPAKLALLVTCALVLRSSARMQTWQPLAIGIALYAISALYFAFLVFLRPLEAEHLGQRAFLASYLVDINHTGIDFSKGLPTSVEILPNETTRLDVQIDTGIR